MAYDKKYSKKSYGNGKKTVRSASGRLIFQELPNQLSAYQKYVEKYSCHGSDLRQ